MEQDSPLLKHYGLDQLQADYERCIGLEAQTAKQLQTLEDERIWDKIGDETIDIQMPTGESIRTAVRPQDAQDTRGGPLLTSEPYEVFPGRDSDVLCQSRLLCFRHEVFDEQGQHEEVVYLLAMTHQEQSHIEIDNVALAFVMPNKDAKRPGAFLHFTPVIDGDTTVSLETHPLTEGKDDVAAEFAKAVAFFIRETTEPSLEVILEADTAYLKLDDKIHQKLLTLGLKTVGDITAKTVNELWSDLQEENEIEGVIARQLIEIRRVLEGHHLSLATPEMYQQPIEELDIEKGELVYGKLYRAGVRTVGDLCAKTENDISCISSIGERLLNRIAEALRDKDLDFYPQVLHDYEN